MSVSGVTRSTSRPSVGHDGLGAKLAHTPPPTHAGSSGTPKGSNASSAPPSPQSSPRFASAAATGEIAGIDALGSFNSSKADAIALATRMFKAAGTLPTLSADPSLNDSLLAPLAAEGADGAGRSPDAAVPSTSSDDDDSTRTMGSMSSAASSGASSGSSCQQEFGTASPVGAAHRVGGSSKPAAPRATVEDDSGSDSSPSHHGSSNTARRRVAARVPSSPSKPPSTASPAASASASSSATSSASPSKATDAAAAAVAAAAHLPDSFLPDQPDEGSIDDPLSISASAFLEARAAGHLLAYQEDRRTLVWTLLCMPGLGALHYAFPSLSWVLLPFSLYFSLAAAVIAHNHNHCPTFTRDWLNIAFGNWISIFYGYPTYAWIPTHNLNHHRFVNRVGDSTITWRHTNEHHAAVASTYFFVSTYHQAGPIGEYVGKARARSGRDWKYLTIVLQYVCFVGAHVALAGLGCLLHGRALGLRQYFMGFFAPALFALWAIMFINYTQHVHCDAWDPYNHSRNFVSPSLNYLLFNNGYHTVHHNNAALHWSLLPAAHQKIEANVTKALLVESFWWFVLDSYFLSLLSSRFGSRQIGRLPFHEPPGLTAPLTGVPTVEAAAGWLAANGGKSLDSDLDASQQEAIRSRLATSGDTATAAAAGAARKEAAQ